MVNSRVPVTVVCGGSAQRPLSGTLAAGLAVRLGPGTVLLRPSLAGEDEPGLAAGGVEVHRIGEEPRPVRPGCQCSATRVDLVATLPALAGRIRAPRRIVVETLPDTDPGPVVTTLVDDFELASMVTLDGVVAAVDGPELAAWMAQGGSAPFPRRAILDQILVADHLVVAGTWGQDPAQVAAFLAILGALAPAGRFHPLARHALDHVSGQCGAWSLARVGDRLRRLRTPLAVPAGDDYGLCGSVVLDVAGDLDPALLDRWVSKLRATGGRNLARFEAEVSVAGDERRRLAKATRSVIRGRRGRPWAPGEERRSRLLISGTDLNAPGLASELAACRAG